MVQLTSVSDETSWHEATFHTGHSSHLGPGSCLICPLSRHSRPSFLLGGNKADYGFQSLSSLDLYFATHPSAPSSSLHYQFTMTLSISAYLGHALTRAGGYLSPTPSSPQSHCPGCICHALPPVIHPDDADLCRDVEGNPWNENTLPVTLRCLAKELTEGSLRNRESPFEYEKALRRFTCIASQASGKHNFGIPYDPHNISESEMRQGISTLAFIMTEIGDYRCPSRSEVMDHIKGIPGTTYQSLYEHLRQVEAAQKPKTLREPYAATTPDSVFVSGFIGSSGDEMSDGGTKGFTGD